MEVLGDLGALEAQDHRALFPHPDLGAMDHLTHLLPLDQGVLALGVLNHQDRQAHGPQYLFLPLGHQNPSSLVLVLDQPGNHGCDRGQDAAHKRTKWMS